MDWKALKRNLAFYLAMPPLLFITRIEINLLDKIPDRLKTPINLLHGAGLVAPATLAPFTTQPRFQGRWSKASKIIGPLFLMLGLGLLVYSSSQRDRTVGADIPPKLLTDRAYRFMRHPTYAGFALASMGWSILFRAAYSTALLPLWIVSFLIQASIEESQQMVPFFGEEYEKYRRETPAFSKLVTFVLVAGYILALLGLRTADRRVRGISDRGIDVCNLFLVWR